jgi:hypothetical protein
MGDRSKSYLGEDDIIRFEDHYGREQLAIDLYLPQRRRSRLLGSATYR